MKRLFSLAAFVLMALFLTAAVNAGEIGTQEMQNFETLGQNEQIIRPKAGISWREKVKNERAVMWRAAEMRNARKRNALMGSQENMEGLTVDSYNAMVLNRNMELAK